MYDKRKEKEKQGGEEEWEQEKEVEVFARFISWGYIIMSSSNNKKECIT